MVFQDKGTGNVLFEASMKSKLTSSPQYQK